MFIVSFDVINCEKCNFHISQANARHISIWNDIFAFHCDIAGYFSFAGVDAEADGIVKKITMEIEI